MNAFLERRGRPIGQTGRKSEKQLAKRLNARQTPNSGAASSKGDVMLGDVLLEAKSTISASLVLKLDWLLKIAQEAMMTGKTPALAVTFTDDSGAPRREGCWVLIREQDFHNLSEKISSVE